MAYEKQEWRDGDPSTPLSAARLNHMEDGIEAASLRAPSQEQWAELADRVQALEDQANSEPEGE